MVNGLNTHLAEPVIVKGWSVMTTTPLIVVASVDSAALAGRETCSSSRLVTLPIRTGSHFALTSLSGCQVMLKKLRFVSFSTGTER
jgi:hypothetical protein